MEIRLSKDFLVFPGETNFSDIWEAFCCKLLNLEFQTNEIYRRTPPENGIDVFYSSKKLAYQCKCTDNADTKGHNLTSIEKSYNDAISVINELDWNEYYLCLNYDMTGRQEQNLRERLPNVKVLGKSFWISLSNKYRMSIYDNIRQLIPISNDFIVNSIENIYPDNYADDLKNKLKYDNYKIMVYSNKSRNHYEIYVSKEFTISNIIQILSDAWKLPGKETLNGFDWKLERSVIFNNRKYPSNNKTLQEIGIIEGSTIFLHTDIMYKENYTHGGMEFITNIHSYIQKNKEPSQRDFYDYEILIEKAFENFDEKLLNDN